MIAPDSIAERTIARRREGRLMLANEDEV
jgi:hypothetical protein